MGEIDGQCSPRFVGLLACDAVPVGNDTLSLFIDLPSGDPLIGTMIDDYEVKVRIGQGAMGIVYRGVHRIIGKTVAIKILKIDYADDPDMVQRLVGEARTVNAIGHPGIVDIFGFGTLKTGQPYIVMDLLEGEPLDVFIKRVGSVKLKAAWPMLDDLLGALGAAHHVGVIHRDLKPGNIFRESHPEARSRIKVIDFGLARTADRAGGSVRPTNPGTLLGTPAFMAPEQVQGTKVTPATDLYAVGGIAYQLLTGHFPHEAPSAMELLSLKMANDPLPLRHWLPSLDEELEQWVLSMLAREPVARPQTADEARRTLRRIVDGRPAHAGGKVKVAVSKTPVPTVRGWSDAKTVLEQPSSSGAEHITDRDDSPFAPTRETPALAGARPVPHFGPTPLPQAAPLGPPVRKSQPSPIPFRDVSRTVPLAAAKAAPSSSPSGLTRTPTKSIVPLVLVALVLLLILTVGLLFLTRQ